MNETIGKEKSIEKLKEESGIVYQIIRAFIFIYGTGLIILLSLLIWGIVMSKFITTTLNASAPLQGLCKLIPGLINYFTNDHPLNTSGQFNSIYFAGSILGKIIFMSIPAYIFYCILKIFRNIKMGVTPFTSKNASYWRKCSNIFSIITVIVFLASFLIHGLIVTILMPLMLSCFFQSLNLIFEYGSFLQTESDETL